MLCCVHIPVLAYRSYVSPFIHQLDYAIGLLLHLKTGGSLLASPLLGNGDAIRVSVLLMILLTRSPATVIVTLVALHPPSGNRGVAGADYPLLAAAPPPTDSTLLEAELLLDLQELKLLLLLLSKDNLLSLLLGQEPCFLIVNPLLSRVPDRRSAINSSFENPLISISLPELLSSVAFRGVEPRSM